jgi:hypothetical protein
MMSGFELANGLFILIDLLANGCLHRLRLQTFVGVFIRNVLQTFLMLFLYLHLLKPLQGIPDIPVLNHGVPLLDLDDLGLLAWRLHHRRALLAHSWH